MEPPTTSTRRALVLVLYSEAPLVLGSLGFVLWPHLGGLLGGGIVLSVLVGAFAAYSLFDGRQEFGPGHAQSVKRAFGTFAVLLGALLLAYFQITDVFPTTLRVTDLRAPWVLLGVVLVADVGSITFTLWHVAGSAGRRWVRATWAVGAVAVLGYVVVTQPAIADMVARSGGVAFNPAEAESYVRDFMRGVVRWWAVALLSLRVTFLPALWVSITNVAEAEHRAAVQP